ncbi:oligosaccharyltransferase complex subunit epsilon [Ascosphaera aggregata]|nr:oligosaccharyltransferase complex subunit epsilon [Ascosphaera aggregata]
MVVKKRVTSSQSSTAAPVEDAAVSNRAVDVKKDVVATTSSTSSTPVTFTSASGLLGLQIACSVWQHYISETSQRILLLDAYLFFLVVVGAIQFVYCVLVGNYPFNAFLAGFGAAVGQFVLTVSLRMQISESPRKSARQVKSKSSNVAPSVSSERAFAEFIFGSGESALRAKPYYEYSMVVEPGWAGSETYVQKISDKIH